MHTVRVQPTDQTANTPADDQEGRPLAEVLDEAVARAQAERDERESCLYRALRLTIGDERFSESADLIIDLAEYLRTGSRGAPLPPAMPPRDTVVVTHSDPPTWATAARDSGAFG